MWDDAAAVGDVWLIKATVIMIFTQFTNTYKKVKIINCILSTAAHLDVKSGQIRDRVRNSGQFSVPNDLVFFSGQTLKIRDCPEKFGI